jgi:hypothetical protein
MLQKCCLRLSANESYSNAEKEVEALTGIKVSHSTQQRIVLRQDLTFPSSKQGVSEVSLDGGKIRLRPAKNRSKNSHKADSIINTDFSNKPIDTVILSEATKLNSSELTSHCYWKDYKAVRLQGIYYAAFFDSNQTLIDYVNSQHLLNPLVCLGDGHDGVWNLVEEFGYDKFSRLEILDWYHLKENLYKVGGSLKRLKQAENLLWSGLVEETLALFSICRGKKFQNFCAYIKKHSSRIVNYEYYQAEGICSIGSGAVESAIKQIGKRIKISGAQWNIQSVNKVLANRCAYLNGLLTV